MWSGAGTATTTTSPGRTRWRTTSRSTTRRTGAGQRATDVDAPVARNQWLTLRVEFNGKEIRVALDGKPYIQVEDGHIAGAGSIGVWTKADSVTLFDDFSFGVVSAR